MSYIDYLGIDESGFGSYPVVYTGVFSKTLSLDDLNILSSKPLSKFSRQESLYDMKQTLKNYDLEYKSILFTEFEGNHYSHWELKLSAFSTLVDYFSRVSDALNLSVTIDGSLTHYQKNSVWRNAGEYEETHLRSKRKADKNDFLVNFAGKISNRIWKELSRNEITIMNNSFIDNLEMITPSLTHYYKQKREIK